MEHISKQILLWLLTHANSCTKFRSVIKHLVIFEPTLIGQNQMPRGSTWLVYFCVFTPTFNCRFSPQKKKKMHWTRELSDPDVVLEDKVSQGHAKFYNFKGYTWSQCFFSELRNAWITPPRGRERKGHHSQQISLLSRMINGQLAKANTGFPSCNSFFYILSWSTWKF
jgi:hypothetical protein